MSWIDKFISLFHSEDNGTDEEIIDSLTKKVIELEKENKDLKKANHTLTEECKRLLDKVDNLKKEKIEWTYSTTDKVLPKQEPIRSTKPKRNRNNHRRYYKKDSDKYAGEVSLIKNKDIPKPGSGDKVEFKNGNPVKRRRKRSDVNE